MAAPLEICLGLKEAIQKAVAAENSSTERLLVAKRTKELRNGDFYVPKGCFPVEKEKLSSVVKDVRDALIQATEMLPFKIKDVKSGSYDTFEIFLDRQSFFSSCIEAACKEGTNYGKSAATQDQMVFLDLACGSELSAHRDVSLDDLRALALSQHIQLLLESRGNKVSIISNAEQISKYETAFKMLDMNSAVTVQAAVTDSEVQYYKDRMVCHKCCSESIQTNSQSVDMYKDSPTKEVETENVPIDIDKNDTKSDKYLSWEFNMKGYILERGLSTGKNNFDKNLHVCQVISQGEATSILKHVMTLDKIMQVSDDAVCLHIVPQNQAFHFQKLHLILEAIQNPDSCSQLQFVYGSVTHRKEDVLTDVLTVEKYFSLRDKQMHEAAVMKYGSAVQGEGWEETIRAITSACIKFELLSSTARSNLKLDLNDTEDSSVSDSRSGSFVMYNCARLATLFTHFQNAVDKGLYPPLPEVKDIDFSTLREEEEWSLVFNFVYTYPDVVRQAIGELQPNNCIFSNVLSHKVCVFLSGLSRCLSSYYSRVHILGENRPHLLQTMFARLYLLKSVHQVMVNGLALLGISALSQL